MLQVPIVQRLTAIELSWHAKCSIIIAMKCNDTYRDCGGFTMVELMIALMISVFLFLVLYSSIAACLAYTTDANEFMAAESLAFDRLWIEYNKKLSHYDGIVTATVDTELTPVDSLFRDRGVIRVAVHPLLSPRRWDVQVNVLWPHRLSGGGEREMSTDLWITRYPSERIVL